MLCHKKVTIIMSHNWYHKTYVTLIMWQQWFHTSAVTPMSRRWHGKCWHTNDVTKIMSKLWCTANLQYQTQRLSHKFSHKNDVTEMMSQKWYHRNDVTEMMSQKWCLKNDVTKMMSQKWCHKNDVTKMMSQKWCHKNDVNVTKMVSHHYYF